MTNLKFRNAVQSDVEAIRTYIADAYPKLVAVVLERDFNSLTHLWIPPCQAVFDRMQSFIRPQRCGDLMAAGRYGYAQRRVQIKFESLQLFGLIWFFRSGSLRCYSSTSSHVPGTWARRCASRAYAIRQGRYQPAMPCAVCLQPHRPSPGAWGHCIKVTLLSGSRDQYRNICDFRWVSGL